MALFEDPNSLLLPALAVVGILAAVMAWMTLRSYRGTGNLKLLFVFIAFVTFVIKSLFLFANDVGDQHIVAHHAALLIGSLFDVIILMLLFVPFLAPPR